MGSGGPTLIPILTLKSYPSPQYFAASHKSVLCCITQACPCYLAYSWFRMSIPVLTRSPAPMYQAAFRGPKICFKSNMVRHTDMEMTVGEKRFILTDPSKLAQLTMEPHREAPGEVRGQGEEEKMWARAK